MIDFTNLPLRKKAYGGANGSKLSVVYNGNLYMLKLPMRASKNPNLSYTNSCTSEYIGCHIFNMLGVKAQETILGTYEHHGIVRNVVACKDFTSPGVVIMEFASVKNQIIDSASNGYGTELSDILDTIEKQNAVDPKVLKEHFWNMFVIDALIGNWDRHNGNWGFLYNQETDQMEIAPIYDCGSALFPQIDDELIKKVMSSKAEMNARVYDVPTSAILINGKRINYYKLITSNEFEDCTNAVKRIIPKVDLDKINHLIDGVEQLSALQKEFLKKMLKLRKELLFDELIKSFNSQTKEAFAELEEMKKDKEKYKRYDSFSEIMDEANKK